MKIRILALVFLILSSTLASGDCGLQTQEDDLERKQFNFTAFRWDGNNTTCLQKIPDEESEAILESLLDSSWVGSNTTYLQKIPQKNAEAILGDLEPSIQKDCATYIFFMMPWDPIVIVVDYVLQKWLEKKAKAKESMGGAGFTCTCGRNYIEAMHANDCCAERKEGPWTFYDGNCEKGCRDTCNSKWDKDGKRWFHNICNKRR
jgi:hypothetical protein